MDWVSRRRCAKAIGESDRIIAANDRSEIAARSELMVQSAIHNDKSLAPALLHLHHTGQVNTGLSNEKSAEFQRKPAFGQNGRSRGKQVRQSIADHRQIEGLIARKIGDAKAPAQIDERRRRTSFIGQAGNEVDGRGLRRKDRPGVQRLRSGKDMPSAPVCPRRNDTPRQRARTICVHAKWPRTAAHPHAGALEFEIRIDPRRKARPNVATGGNAQRAFRLAFRFQIDGHSRIQRGGKLPVGLSRPGEAYPAPLEPCFLRHRQFSGGGNIEPVDQLLHQRQQGREWIGLHRVMKVEPCRHGRTQVRDTPAEHLCIIDEQRRLSGLVDKGRSALPAKEQHALFALEAGRNRSRRLQLQDRHDAFSIACAARATRSTLPLGLRGNASKILISAGCMKLGNV